VTEKNEVVCRLPKKDCGFIKPVNGVLPKTDYHKLPHGIWCQDEGHLGPFQKFTRKQKFVIHAKEADLL
jgi:hypothetical protein